MGKIRKITVYSEKLLEDRKILLISDIHKQKGKSENHLKLIKSQLVENFHNIDFVVIPGDVVNDANDLQDKSFNRELAKELEQFLSGKKTIISLGNHDQMHLNNSKKWEPASNELIYEALDNVPNIKLLRNGELIVDGDMSFSSFSPNVRYYTERKENIEDYKKEFYEFYNENLFNEETYNVFLTHEPQSIIKLSRLNKSCIQNNTDLVVSGHMHNGLLPNIMQPFFKNRGLLSPQLELFPEFAQGTYKVAKTDFIINGAVNTRVETPLINSLYSYNATLIDIKSQKTKVR